MDGFLVDKLGAKTTMAVTGTVAAIGLMLVPYSLVLTNTLTNTPESAGEGIPTWACFTGAILLWSTSVASCGPATTALAQEFAPEGSEATAMALPRAAGDGVYLFAPFLLGSVADLANLPLGSECFVAGFCGLLGVAALVLL